MRSIVESLKSGQLTEAAARSLVDGTAVDSVAAAAAPGVPAERVARHLCCATATWALFTVEWMDSVHALLCERGLGGARVLEVCAGNGCLTQPMRDRGYDWIATDQRPDPMNAVDPNLRSLSALGAVFELKPDLVFWSWWPRLGAADHWWRCAASRPVLRAGRQPLPVLT